MTKVQVAIACAVLLVGGGACLFSLQGQAARREKLDQVETQNASLLKQISAVAVRSETLDHQLTTLQARVADGSNAIQQERFRLDHIVRKGELDLSWASFFIERHLSPAQVDALKSLIVERNQAGWDATQIAKKQGFDDLLPSERQRLETVAAAEVYKRIEALLGPTGLEAFKDYEGRDQVLILLAYGGLDYSVIHELAKNGSDWLRPVDAKVRNLLKTAVPEYDDECYLAMERLPLPAAVLQEMSELCPPKYRRFFSSYNSNMAIESRILAIERTAAAEGRLFLTKDSAKEYGVGMKPGLVPAATRSTTP